MSSPASSDMASDLLASSVEASVPSSAANSEPSVASLDSNSKMNQFKHPGPGISSTDKPGNVILMAPCCLHMLDAGYRNVFRQKNVLDVSDSDESSGPPGLLSDSEFDNSDDEISPRGTLQRP